MLCSFLFIFSFSWSFNYFALAARSRSFFYRNTVRERCFLDFLNLYYSPGDQQENSAFDSYKTDSPRYEHVEVIIKIFVVYYDMYDIKGDKLSIFMSNHQI